MNCGALIMAGGKGERFWPASRENRPKQLLSFGMQHPLLVQTVQRVLPLIPASRQLVITSESLKAPIGEILPEFKEFQIIGEPVGRNTAPCVGVAAVWMSHHFGPDCIMTVLSADHAIARTEAFLAVLQTAMEAAREDFLVTIGLQPTRPETGYGHLELGDCLDEKTGLYRVNRFLEKPALPEAERFASDGRHLWNGGMFLWKCSRILEELQRHLPELSESLEEYHQAIGTPEESSVLRDIYPRMPSISIDYAVMEKADRVVTVRADIGWDDLGNWAVLERLHPPDAEGNIVTGPHTGVETRDCIVSADRGLIATFGVEDLVVVKEGDVVLVMPKERAADLKQLIAAIKNDPKWKAYL